VDDNLITHIDPAVVSQVINNVEKKFGKMSMSRGKEHEILGMNIKLHQDRTVSIDMKYYIKNAIDSYQEDMTKNASTPAIHFLFDVR
jgi:Reverse transcriptase (RNA-dependent DNA polymerase).